MSLVIPSPRKPKKNACPRTTSGGTLRMPYLRETHGGHHLKCSLCKGSINSWYYVHQCVKIPHNWCNVCLFDTVKRGRMCEVCKHPFAHLNII